MFHPFQLASAHGAAVPITLRWYDGSTNLHIPRGTIPTYREQISPERCTLHQSRITILTCRRVVRDGRGGKPVRAGPASKLPNFRDFWFTCQGGQWELKGQHCDEDKKSHRKSVHDLPLCQFLQCGADGLLQGQSVHWQTFQYQFGVSGAIAQIE